MRLLLRRRGWSSITANRSATVIAGDAYPDGAAGLDAPRDDGGRPEEAAAALPPGAAPREGLNEEAGRTEKLEGGRADAAAADDEEADAAAGAAAAAAGAPTAAEAPDMIPLRSDCT